MKRSVGKRIPSAYIRVSGGEKGSVSALKRVPRRRKRKKQDVFLQLGHARAWEDTFEWRDHRTCSTGAHPIDEEEEGRKCS